MEVLVEVLLALLAQPSHLIRQVARTVFSHICSHLTPRALQLILDVSCGPLGKRVPGCGCPSIRLHQCCLVSPCPRHSLQSGWGPHSHSAAVQSCSRAH